MTVHEFCDRHNACREGREWGEQFSTMSDCWDALVADDEHCDWAWWVLTRDGVLTPQERTLLVCDIVRNTPIGNGRTVWNLLTDERSRHAIEVAEAWARGEAADADLAAAEAAAWAAREAAWTATWAAALAAREAPLAAREAAWTATWAAADAAEAAERAAVGAAERAAVGAARAAARAWQMTRLRARPNPFREVTA